ncbi:MAG: sigma-E processing peptidase SpoIIGA, partial [Clostridia bacterium]|nr:sigma-E processing peptidase SpoIIGA [Clostridia bacterium]
MIISEHGVICLNTVIYADILIIINLIVNYMILRASTAIVRYEFKTWRLLASAAIG